MRKTVIYDYCINLITVAIALTSFPHMGGSFYITVFVKLICCSIQMYDDWNLMEVKRSRPSVFALRLANILLPDETLKSYRISSKTEGSRRLPFPPGEVDCFET